MVAHGRVESRLVEGHGGLRVTDFATPLTGAAILAILGAYDLSPYRTRSIVTRTLSSTYLTLAFAVLSLLALPTEAATQVVASERSTVSQVVSGTEIVIDYSRPSARGRTELFGGAVAWGRTWTGANSNTTLHFSDDVTLGGEEVSAGTYGVWIQPMEEGSWQFMLHEDTTLFHTRHPPLEDGLLTLPMHTTQGADFVETMRWDLQDVRATGAELVLAWGTERASIDLGVDPGYVLTVDPIEAARYVGDWEFDQSMTAPPEDRREAMRANRDPADLEIFDAYMAAITEPRPMSIVYTAAQLILDDPQMDAVMATAQGAGFQTLLMPRTEGIFEPGTMLRGDLAFAGGQGLWEFEFDEEGQAVSFVVRDASDAIVGRGARAGAR